MCGIAGFIDLSGQARGGELESAARAMADSLIHRGPDSDGLWRDDEAGVAFAFRRLAILDVTEAGNQPMASANGRYVIVYNGEVYNFRILRQELEAAGTVFHGDSDTEVILEGFARWGVPATVKRFVGMFAFALWDRAERRLWLGRDRLGIKPLYWGLTGGLFLFGSELKALRAKSGWQPKLDRDALASFARFNYIPAPQTIYTDIRKLEAGTLLSFRAGLEPEITRDWDIAEVAGQARRDISDADAIEETEALLSEAVSMRLVSDVPLGALLSGGVDSAAVVALMQQASSRPVRTFTIGFNEAGFNESAHARAVADHLGTDHTEVTLSPERACDLVPRLADWYDEPFADSSALPTRLVSEIARRHVTVALSGDGGDEVFMGYNRYQAAESLWRRTRSLPGPLRNLAAGGIGAVPMGTWDTLAGLLPAGRRPGLAGDKMYKLAGMLRAGNEDDAYRGLVSHWPNPEALVPGGHERIAVFWEQAKSIADFAERMAFLDTATYLPGDILHKVDRASMSISLEARVPLLDHRIVEFAWSMPKHLRLRDGQGKWLLRQVLYRHVPREIIERPKSGFAVPIGDWLRGPLRDWAEDLLDEQRLREEGWFDAAMVRNAWDAHLAGRGNHWQALWGVCMAQAWGARWADGMDA
jgi:asparagine synthase (glutamine-hydrolysing)